MKSNATLVFAIGLLLTAQFSFGQITPKPDSQGGVMSAQDLIPMDPKVKVGKLDNGLTYYIRNNGKPEDKLELRLVVNAGSILEDEDQLGLAHFMEHMNFNGTENFEKNDIVDYLQSIGVRFGADLNAYTRFDETVYILPIPSDDSEKLEKGFQILEDWAHGTLLTEKDIDEERGVVLEEYRLGQGAEERMLQKYFPKIMNNSKYAKRLPIGTKESIENFSYESLRRYYRDWYRPDLMAVVAVGDLDPAIIEEKIKGHFGNIAKAQNPRLRPEYDVPNHQETYVAIETDKESTFNRVQVMYKDRGERKRVETLNDYRDNMIEGLFSQMLNNRLDELSNSPEPPFVYGYSYHGGTWARNKEAYQSFAMSSETGQMTALRALLEENERIKRYGFTEGEFKRAKKDYMARIEKSYNEREKQESSKLASKYVYNYLEDSPTPGIEWSYEFTMATLPSVKLKEVNALIKDFIHDDNRVIIFTGGEKEGTKKPTEAEVMALLKEVEASEIAPYEEEEIRSSLMTDIPEAGKIVDTKNNEVVGTTTVTLSNGLKVTYKKTDFKNDEIIFRAFSYGGTSLYDTEQLDAMSEAMGGLTEAGVDGLKKTDLDKVLSGKIVNTSVYVSGIREGMRGNTTPKDLESLMQLIHLYFTKLNKDPEAFQSYIKKQKAFLGNILSNPRFYYQVEFGKFLNEGNPRYFGFPTPERLDNTNYDLAYETYKERFANAGDFNFYFVGNIDEEVFLSLLETYLGSLPGTDTREEYVVHPFRPKSGSHEFSVKKGKDPKSNVSLMFQGPTDHTSEEAFAMRILGEILSIKLIEKLREEESGVYGVGASGSIQKIPYGWYSLSIRFPCGPENVERLTMDALKEVNDIVENGPTDKDLQKVKEAQLLKRKEDLKTNKFWLSSLESADYQGKDINKIMEFESKVDALTAEDIQKVAQKYLTKGYINSVQMPEGE